MIGKINALMTINELLGLGLRTYKGYVGVDAENNLSLDMVERLKDSYDNYTAILNKYAVSGEDFNIPKCDKEYVIKKLQLIKTITNRIITFYIGEEETLRDYKISLGEISSDVSEIFRRSVVDYKTFLLCSH